MKDTLMNMNTDEKYTHIYVNKTSVKNHKEGLKKLLLNLNGF